MIAYFTQPKDISPKGFSLISRAFHRSVINIIASWPKQAFSKHCLLKTPICKFLMSMSDANRGSEIIKYSFLYSKHFRKKVHKNL